MANLFNQLGLFGANAAQMMPQPVQPAKLGLLDRLGRQLVPGDSQWSPSDDERKAMMKRGLLEAGLTMLATPTGTGSPIAGIARGLLAGKDAMQADAVDMRNQRLGLGVGRGGILPAKIQEADYFAKKSGLKEGTKEYMDFMSKYSGASSEGIDFKVINDVPTIIDSANKSFDWYDFETGRWNKVTQPGAGQPQGAPQQRDWSRGDKPQSLEEIQDWYKFWQGNGIPKEQLDKGANQLALGLEYTKDFKIDGQAGYTPPPVSSLPPPVNSGGQPNPFQKPDAAKEPTWNTPVVETRGGKRVRVRYNNQGGEQVLGEAEPDPVDPSKLTDDMRKTSTLLSRMDFSLNQIREVEASDKAANRPGYGVAAIDYLPDAIGNDLKSSGRQQVEAAQLDALDAALTLATGAAYTKEQLIGLRKAYFPQPNDSEATIKAKQARFENVIQSARVRAGSAAQTPIKPPGVLGDKPVPQRNSKGWLLHTDKAGNRAYVSPDKKQFEAIP
jgi:hypothetical protein